MRDPKSAANERSVEGPKKAYEKPEVLSRERLEALAVVCSPPSKADVAMCPSGTITS